ncbi:hypothetical protein GO730_00175 [Spirosoma sp. HMF3257]|uniref:Uncharacterized protein n=1 Tax=Spirosoma telluris TaxID=2183553 RepID=A0A327NH08_9BACT|nr:hypothetical protein [Spirosoma telluris]RAI73224.1 hypothetical protein HMF3257_00175 [Spirosoma telluris]
MRKALLAIILVLYITTGLLAQDVIYTANGNRLENAQITGLSESKLTFTAQGKTLTFLRQNILIAFRKNGNFLVISELGDDLTQAEQRLQGYLSAPSRTNDRDYIIKAVPLTVIPASIAYENQTIVNYTTKDGKSASIPKGELIGILYRDGRHLLLRDAIDVAPLLVEVKERLNANSLTVNPQSTIATVNPPVSVQTYPKPTNSLPQQSSEAALSEKDRPAPPTTRLQLRQSKKVIVLV